MRYQSDIELLLDLKHGRSKAFEYCYKSYLPMVRKWILKNNGLSEEADDVFQDALMVVYDKTLRDDLELQVKFSTYLMSICKYQWLKKLKDKSKVVDLDETEYHLHDNVESDIKFFEQQEQDYEKMHRAMLSLGSPCKELISAYYLEDRNMQEISELFEYTNANNAKTQKYKCLQRLKKLFYKEQKQYETDSNI